MLRFELDQPLTFNNVREETRGSIYRWSLVVKMKGKFLPPSEYAALDIDNKEQMGIFVKGDTLEPFLESRPASASLVKLIRLYEYTHSRRMS